MMPAFDFLVCGWLLYLSTFQLVNSVFLWLPCPESEWLSYLIVFKAHSQCALQYVGDCSVLLQFESVHVEP